MKDKLKEDSPMFFIIIFVIIIVIYITLSGNEINEDLVYCKETGYEGISSTGNLFGFEQTCYKTIGFDKTTGEYIYEYGEIK